MRVSITPTDDVLTRYGNQLGALSQRDGHKALARAVNRTTNTVYSRVVRAVAKQSSIKAATVRRTVKKRLARPGDLGSIEGVVWATGKPIPLKAFSPKQFSYGVKAKVYGQMTRFPGAFIFAGTYRSGIYVGNGQVFQNTRGPNARSGRTNAIEMQTGPSVPEELVKGEAKRQFEITVAEMLPRRVSHELNRLLPDE